MELFEDKIKLRTLYIKAFYIFCLLLALLSDFISDISEIKAFESLLVILGSILPLIGNMKNIILLFIFGTLAFSNFGDGDRRVELEHMAEELGIGDRVRFTGLLSSSREVRDRLLGADLFIFLTKAEGLPRAVIEAMAVGLPCLSTPVNGIPELLPPQYMFNPIDVDGFANKIIQLISNPEEMSQMSKMNIHKAREYEYEILDKRRCCFYSKLKKIVHAKT